MSAYGISVCFLFVQLPLFLSALVTKAPDDDGKEKRTRWWLDHRQRIDDRWFSYMSISFLQYIFLKHPLACSKIFTISTNSKNLIRWSLTDQIFFLILRVLSLGRWHIQRRRQVVAHSIQQRLNTLVLEGSATQDRHKTLVDFEGCWGSEGPKMLEIWGVFLRSTKTPWRLHIDRFYIVILV